ncbi:MAG: replication-associated recombination protein A [Mycoplasma sp.]
MSNNFTFPTPKKLNEIIGQNHLTNPNSLVSKMIENKQPQNIIFFGNPGIGKSSIIKVIIEELKVKSTVFNAAVDKKEVLTKIIKENLNDPNFILIVEEIHRMNKDKQDILLPYLETNEIKMLAATTENPYFKINPAIRSRSTIFQLNSISKEELSNGLKTILDNHKINYSIEELVLISNVSNGDCRTAQNILTQLINFYPKQKITNELLKEIYGNNFNAGGDESDTYNIMSAFHKSLRGSDPDASIYYLAKLIEIGAVEDAIRRMLCVAYEDVGLANPELSSRVSIGINSFDRLGLPEGRLILSSLCIQLACSPKSNSAYKAIDSALYDIKNNKSYNPPKHIQDNHYAGAKQLGITNYQYPFDYERNWVNQQYLPNELKDIKYWNPKLLLGNEETMVKWINWMKKNNPN